MSNILQWCVALILLGFGLLGQANGQIYRVVGNKKLAYFTFTVDQSGHGDFTSIQSAIDAVPSNNKHWVSIKIKGGTYREKVAIPEDKPYIILKGESKRKTLIVWDDHGSVTESYTFASYANNTIVKSISILNSYNNPVNSNPKTTAVAALIAGDKSTFYRCGFFGFQDTLWDVKGRHYYKLCTIEGAVDFIFGSGQSIFEVEKLIHFFFNITRIPLKLIQNVGRGIRVRRGGMPVLTNVAMSTFVMLILRMNDPLQESSEKKMSEKVRAHRMFHISSGWGGGGYITAQKRDNSDETTGFVFKNCKVIGAGSTFLGRPWGAYSRVIFYNSNITDVVVPEGWSSWDKQAYVKQMTYAEYGCYGKGANTSKRVSWEKKLSPYAVRQLVSLNFIDSDGWLSKQPF